MLRNTILNSLVECLILKKTGKLSSKVAILFSVPISSEWEFLLLYILASVWWCVVDSVLDFGQVVHSDI